MAPMNITQNEILDAILAHFGEVVAVDDAVTTEQLVDVLHVSETTVRRHLKRLIKDGQVDVVWVMKTGIAGQQCRVPGYRVKNTAG